MLIKQLEYKRKDLKWLIESIEIDSGDGRLYIFLIKFLYRNRKWN